MTLPEITSSLGAVVGVIAAVVSIVFAVRSEKSAKHVEAATRRLADAAEKANEIQLNSVPSPGVSWGDANWRAGDTYSIKNIGTAAAYVKAVESEPLEHSNLLVVRTDLPCVINPGDSIEFMTIATFQGRADPVIVWSLSEGAEPLERTRRSAIKPR